LFSDTVVDKGGGVIASILIIDDDPQIRLLLRHVLEAEGHVVLQASNGRQGLSMAQLTSPDLVITDVLMPDTDGLEVTVTLHRECPAIRIIAFSGSGEEMDYLGVAKMLGAHRTLRKPLTMADLLNAVEQELEIASRTAKKNGYTSKDDAMASE
jgi:DNA-binding response OmpR family regulator